MTNNKNQINHNVQIKKRANLNFLVYNLFDAWIFVLGAFK